SRPLPPSLKHIPATYNVYFDPELAFYMDDFPRRRHTSIGYIIASNAVGITIYAAQPQATIHYFRPNDFTFLFGDVFNDSHIFYSRIEQVINEKLTSTEKKLKATEADKERT
ncbi:14517_t:CDS:2, partial [Ambispora leptoticha]